MNTNIYLWIDPMVINHSKGTDKIYFNYIVEGQYADKEVDELEDFISGDHLTSIMDYADIESNWSYGVVSANLTSKKPEIAIVLSPEQVVKQAEEKKENKRIDTAIAKIVTSTKELSIITKEDMEILDNGKIKVSLPSLKINDEIDFPKIWNSLEKDFMGKIKEGDTVTLTDDDGNKIFEMLGGNFLNIGISDLKVYDSKKKSKINSLLSEYEGLKGGLFLRDDGSLEVGDTERTFYLRIHTNNLLKASLKLKKSLMELTNRKLLNQKND